MSIIHVAGPTEIHVANNSGNYLQFLGWSEGGVRVSNRPFYEDVKSDLQGPMATTDVQMMGAECWISLDLKIWNEDVWQTVASRAFAGSGSAVAEGYYPSGSIGALVELEGLTYRLLVYMPYGSKTAFLMAGQRICYNFQNAYLAGPDDVDPLATRAEKIRVVFRALLSRDPVSGDNLLYNQDYSGKGPAL